MVYIFVTILIPGHKAAEVAKAGFQARKKYPEDESIGKYVVQSAILSSAQGAKSVSILEPKEGKERDALIWLAKRAQPYSAIEGVIVQYEIASTYDEALEIVGIQRP